MTEFFHSCTTNERKREIGKCVTSSITILQSGFGFFYSFRPASGWVFNLSPPRQHISVARNVSDALMLLPRWLNSFFSFADDLASHAHFLLPAEELLNNFAQQNGAWRHCLFFLSNTRNEYVMMYSLTVFEVSFACGDACSGFFYGSMNRKHILRKFCFSDRGSKPGDLRCFCSSPSVRLIMRHKYDFFKMLNSSLYWLSCKRISTQT